MNRALHVGARQQEFDNHNFDGWQSMDTAPRDGTVIEFKCTAGVAPWYGLFKWSDEQHLHVGDNGIEMFKGEFGWQGVSKLGSSVDGGGHFHWRPFSGDSALYVDPTGGMQNDPAYWRGAVASKYSLPLDHYEAPAALNAKPDATPQPQVKAPASWWRRFFLGQE